MWRLEFLRKGIEENKGWVGDDGITENGEFFFFKAIERGWQEVMSAINATDF